MFSKIPEMASARCIRKKHSLSGYVIKLDIIIDDEKVWPKQFEMLV